jgi:hypothetical protein
MSLDLLGAGEGLGTKAITVRVKRVDVDRLKQKVGNATAILPFVDQAPEIALRAALPAVARMAANDYGVELEWQLSDAGGRELEGNGGVALGFGVGIGLAALGWLVSKAF